MKFAGTDSRSLTRGGREVKEIYNLHTRWLTPANFNIDGILTTEEDLSLMKV